jgi:predicted amidohydrolase YtcJ
MRININNRDEVRMMKQSHIGSVAIALLLAGCGGLEAPDLILHNAKVFTASGEPEWTQALAVAGDRIVEIGSSEAVLALAGPSTRIIDVEGRVIVPGFNDAHLHTGSYRIKREIVQFGDGPPDPTLDEVIDSLRAAAARTPVDTWLWVPVGGTVFADPRTESSRLTEAVPDHPVVLQGWAGHGRVLNAAAERQVEPLIAERWPRSPRPPEGASRKGVRHGYDGFRVDAALQREPDSVLAAEFDQAQAEALAWGITSIQMIAYPTDEQSAAAALERVGPRLRWSFIRMPMDPNAPAGPTDQPSSEGAVLFSAGGVKVLLDGSPVERMALLRGVYADVPDDWSGMTYMSFEQLRAVVARSVDTGEQLAVHAVGDGAVSLLFRTLQQHDGIDWSSRRVRLEHGDGVAEDLLEVARALGIVVVQNPTHFSLTELLDQRMGQVGRSGWQPMHSLVRAGVPVALGSDGPVNPFVNIMFAVLHPVDPAEALSVEEAVIAYTRGSAYAQFAESEKGTLEPGRLADLAVLSQDIFEIAPDQLPATTSLLTLVGGSIAQAKPPFSVR